LYPHTLSLNLPQVKITDSSPRDEPRMELGECYVLDSEKREIYRPLVEKVGEPEFPVSANTRSQRSVPHHLPFTPEAALLQCVIVLFLYTRVLPQLSLCSPLPLPFLNMYLTHTTI
jgi:hypothetical protein